MNRVRILEWDGQHEDWQIVLEVDRATYDRALITINAIAHQHVLSMSDNLKQLASVTASRAGQSFESFGPWDREQIVNASRVWYSLLPMLGYDHASVAAGWLVFVQVANSKNLLIVEVTA